MNQALIKPPYYIELLSRDKNLKERHRFLELPIQIGRGYDNDLILDDPYIAENHAIIEMTSEGNLQIRDLDSENGLVSEGKKQPVMTVQDKIIRLGHTNLRVRHAGFPVKKAIPDKASHRWEGWPPAIVGLLFVLLSALATTWLSSTESFSIVAAIASIALVMFLVLLWCGGWGFATRMIGGGSARFGRHIFIVGCAILLIDFWNMISITFAYAFSLPFLTRYGSHIEILILAGMIFFHLMTINSQRPKRFMTTCAVLAILGMSTILISNYQRSGQLADTLYMTGLLPPALRISGNMPVEAFIESANELKPKLEKARKKPANTRQGVFGN
jgi:hypothetical protein